MWLAASFVGLLLFAPHVLSRTRLQPTLGIALWWSVIALRGVVVACAALVVLLYLPAFQLFDQLTRWCMHAVVPFVTAHLGLSGDQVGHAASVVPALFVVVSVSSALLGASKAARLVRGWLQRSAIGEGPRDSLLVSDPRAVLAAAGVRSPRVVVSDGALAVLDDAELAAGLEHEWGHVRRLQRIVILTSSLLSSISTFLPGGASAFRHVQFHLERDADRYAVRATGNPLALASAICKVSGVYPGSENGPVLLGLAGGSASDRLRLLLSGGAFTGSRTQGALAALLALAAASLSVSLLLAVPTLVEGGLDLAGPGAPAVEDAGQSESACLAASARRRPRLSAGRRAAERVGPGLGEPATTPAGCLARPSRAGSAALRALEAPDLAVAVAGWAAGGGSLAVRRQLLGRYGR